MVLAGMDELRDAWLNLKSYVDALTHERQHYIDFFERADAAYLVTDAGGMITEVNGAAVDLFDRRRNYLKGKPLAVLVSPDRRREFRLQLQGLSRPAQWRSAFACQGRRIEVELKARPIPDSRGIVWLLQPAE